MRVLNLTDIALYLAPLIGAVTFLIGVGAVFSPTKMSKNFGVSVSGSAVAFVVATGVRDIFMGLTMLVLFYYQSWSMMGWISLLVSLVAFSDFYVVKKFGDSKVALVHLAGAVFMLVYGGWLLSLPPFLVPLYRLSH